MGSRPSGGAGGSVGIGAGGRVTVGRVCWAATGLTVTPETSQEPESKKPTMRMNVVRGFKSCRTHPHTFYNRIQRFATGLARWWARLISTDAMARYRFTMSKLEWPKMACRV